MRTRQRILAAATATVVALGMSLGGAGAAFADHNGGGATVDDLPTVTGVTLTDDNGLTCDGAGYTKPDAMNAPSGTYSADWGSVSWNGASFTWTLNAQYDVDFCVKGSTLVAGVDTSAFAGTTYDFSAQTGHDISHTGFRIVSTPQPTPVTPSATATQYSCVDEAVAGGYITVDLTVPGVTYSIEDESGNPVAFDGTTGRTAALPAGDYTVAGVDADSGDLYTATPLNQNVTINEFTEDCTDLPTFPNWPASVTVTDEACVDYTVTDGAINVVFPEGSEENPNPIRYFIDYEGEDEQELTQESTVVPAGSYVVTAVVTDLNDSVNDSGTSAEFPVTVEGVDAAACTDLPSYPNWPASVTVTDEQCVQFSVTDGAINVVFPEGSEENPNPIRYFIDYEGEDEQELTQESTVVPAGSYVVTAVVTDLNDSVNDSGTSAEFAVTVEGVDAEECDFDFPTFPNWPASVSTTDEVCGPFDVVSGSITVTFPAGSVENPTPVRYFIDYEGENEQELTEETTQVPAGSYVVTAVVTDPNDSVNDSGTSDVFAVAVAGQDADECGELETLAYTGASDLTGAFGLAALLITLTGMGMVVARRRVEA
ncbi:hypothetical protein [Chryseoglobus sp. 28M-23]|uniref:hypothetical protein n=1 Tax=Chryseoglobus sp. 28M-23 TaxID=2772253 RepID=UPI0017465F43|nr:hypothetical protein [Chryseoglobus sp. 28M-23]QOD93723.1 hypothetical protein IE160_00245 [Chryseoglobus sp. 28M-23]